MVTVDKSTERVVFDKKFMRRFVWIGGLPLITWLAILFVVLVYLSSLELSSEPISLPFTIILWVVSLGCMFGPMFAAVVLGEKLRIKIIEKYRNVFINELMDTDFKCDVVFDSGKSTYGEEIREKFKPTGDPAFIAVDYEQKRIAIKLYYNPKETYIIPAKRLEVWGGTNDKFKLPGYDVCSALRLRFYGTYLHVPTRVWHKPNTRYRSIEYHSREDYESGNVSKRFREAVEKADDFAKVLKNLTALN